MTLTRMALRSSFVGTVRMGNRAGKPRLPSTAVWGLWIAGYGTRHSASDKETKRGAKPLLERRDLTKNGLDVATAVER